jgi:hypothetical protein
VGAFPPLAVQVATWTRIAPVLGRSARELEATLVDLVDRVAGIATAPGRSVLVVPDVDPSVLVRELRLTGSARPGTVDPNHGPEGLAPYGPRADLDLPAAPAYVALGVERGDGYRGRPPSEALADVAARGRSPLTIAEGLAAVLVEPMLLERNHCFSLAGSTRGDRRVPAVWISAGAPKLGWCWAGNPHDWLGLASCAARVA